MAEGLYIAIFMSTHTNSRNYVRKVLENVADVRVGDPVVSVRRNAKKKYVSIINSSGFESHFDHVIMATHTDTALSLLGPDASALETEILGAIKYTKNRAVLHRDPSVLLMFIQTADSPS